MSYTKRADIVLDGWTVVELDTGELVAVRCSTERVTRPDAEGSTQALSYRVTARVVDAQGEPVNDAAGQAIQTTYGHSTTLDVVDSLGDANIVRDLLMAALGEPMTVLNLSDKNKAQASIREAIAASSFVGAADAGAVL